MANLLTLPVVSPKVLDFSVLNTHARCPRLCFYQYFLNRAPTGTNYPIGFGIAVHKFMELIEVEWMKAIELRDRFDILDDQEWLDFVFDQSFAEGAKDYDDPPIGHKKDWMTRGRLRETCELLFEQWQTEKVNGKIQVISTEHAFTLQLPSLEQMQAGWTMGNGEPPEGPDYGGRMDQDIIWASNLWARDYKTTSRMGPTYGYQFKVDNQMTGYTWGLQMLSGGRQVEGVRIEVIYNTKTKGPEVHQFLATRSEGAIHQWIHTVLMEMQDMERHLALTPEMGMYAWPQRTNSCNDYGGCWFRDACEKEWEPEIENWLLDNTEHSVWDFTNPDAEAGIPE